MVQELFTLSGTQPGNIGKKLNSTLNRSVTAGAKRASRGFWAATGTGFGKGALLVAGIVLLGAMTFGALSGTSPAFDPTIPLGMAETQGFGAGLVSGLGAGINFLLQGPGLVLMAMGGTVGAVADVRTRQNEIETQVAQQISMTRETARDLEQVQEMGLVPDPDMPHLHQQRPTPAPQHHEQSQHPTQEQPHFRDAFAKRNVDTMPDISYRSRELERRAQMAETGQVKGA